MPSAATYIVRPPFQGEETYGSLPEGKDQIHDGPGEQDHSRRDVTQDHSPLRRRIGGTAGCLAQVSGTPCLVTFMILSHPNAC